MEKFAFSFFDFDNDRTRTAQECVYVPEKAFCKLDDDGECENTFGCKSGDTLGNLANGCAVGRNGKYEKTGCEESYHTDSNGASYRGSAITGTPGCTTGDEMIAIDRIEGVEWPTATNDHFGDPTHTVWTDNGATESTNITRICAINIGDSFHGYAG